MSDDVELEHWEPTAAGVRAWAAITTALAIPLLVAFAVIAAIAGGGRTDLRVDGTNIWWLAALTIGTLVVHEVVHGVAVLAFGRRPRFGAGRMHGVPYFYTTADAPFARDQFIAIALLPLLAISLAGIALMFAAPAFAAWLIIPLAFNVIGSIGDANLVLVVIRYPRDVVVRDERTGITIVARRNDSRTSR